MAFKEEIGMNVYCLYCEHGKGDSVALFAERLFMCRAIYPKQIQHLRKPAGIAATQRDGEPETREVERALLPGYVFVYFENEKADINRLTGLVGAKCCLRDSSVPPPFRRGSWET